MIPCEECGKWHLVFSKKLSVAAHSKLRSILDDVSYTWEPHLKTLRKFKISDLCCEDTIEQLYYSAGYEDICIFCAATCDLVENLPSSVYHICTSCNSNKDPIQKRRTK